jgi:hypothetical protein
MLSKNEEICAIAKFVQDELMAIGVRSYQTGSMVFIGSNLERPCHDIDLVLPLDIYADATIIAKIVDTLKPYETKMSPKSPLVLQYDSAHVVRDYHEWVEQEGDNHPLDFAIKGVEVNLFFDTAVGEFVDTLTPCVLPIPVAIDHKRIMGRRKDLVDIAAYEKFNSLQNDAL